MSKRTALDQLIGLIPASAQRVGTVWAVLDAYRLKVQIPTGEFMVVKGGGYSINDRVLIEGDRVIQKVPSLPSTTQTLVI